MCISGLGYITIEASDLEQWRTFGCDVLGFMTTSTADSNTLSLKMDAYPYRLRIVKGSLDRFLLPGWEVYDKCQFHDLVSHLRDIGCSPKIGSTDEAQLRNVREYAHVVDPTGSAFEIYYGMQLDYAPLVSPVGVKEFVTGHNGDMGLGHIAISTPDLAKSLSFYTDDLQFGKTDYMHFQFSDDANDPGQGLHFLHCDNPRHHSIALFEDSKQPSGSLIHLMFEVPDIDQLGYMIDRVNQHGIKVVTPIGKHTNDEMVSVYVESPAGFAIEYGFGGVQVDWDHYRPTESAKPSLWGHNW